MASEQGDRHLADKLEPLAKAGLPNPARVRQPDPWLDRDTRRREELQGARRKFHGIIRQGEGHFPAGCRSEPVVDSSSKKQTNRMQTTKSKRNLVLGLGIAGLAVAFVCCASVKHEHSSGST